jgi:hypothetical protein
MKKSRRSASTAVTSRITRSSEVARLPSWLLTPAASGTSAMSARTCAVITLSSIAVLIPPGPGSIPGFGSIGKCSITPLPAAAASRALSAPYRTCGSTESVSR